MNKEKLYNTRGCAETQHNDVVQNYSSLTNNNYIKEKIKEYLNVYSHALDLITQTRGQWKWDQREEGIAEEIINLGVTVHEFRKAVQKKLHQCRKEYSRPPYTIAYFKAYWQPKPKTTEGITKELGKKMKPKYTHVYKT